MSKLIVRVSEEDSNAKDTQEDRDNLAEVLYKWYYGIPLPKEGFARSLIYELVDELIDRGYHRD